MRKLIIASAALVGLAGAAVAQEAPALIYGDNVAQNVQNAGVPANGYSGQASATQQVTDQAPALSSFLINQNQNYSGR